MSLFSKAHIQKRARLERRCSDLETKIQQIMLRGAFGPFDQARYDRLCAEHGRLYRNLQALYAREDQIRLEFYGGTYASY